MHGLLTLGRGALASAERLLVLSQLPVDQGFTVVTEVGAQYVMVLFIEPMPVFLSSCCSLVGRMTLPPGTSVYHLCTNRAVVLCLLLAPPQEKPETDVRFAFRVGFRDVKGAHQVMARQDAARPWVMAAPRLLGGAVRRHEDVRPT